MYTKYISRIISPTSFHTMMGLYPKWTGLLQATPDYICKPRILEDYFLFFISNGSCYFNSNGKDFVINKNDVYFLFPDVIHSYKTDESDPVIEWWIGFNGANAKIILHELGITPENPVVRSVSDPLFKQLIEELLEISSCSSPNNILKASGILHLLFNILSEKCSNSYDSQKTPSDGLTDGIRSARLFLDVNYPNNISMEQTAKYANMSRSHFSTKFKAETGQSPLEYLTEIRIQRAKQYLNGSALSIAETASSVGIFDEKYFSRLFKKIIGISPSEYRDRTLSIKL